jgi:hypothetical protein
MKRLLGFPLAASTTLAALGLALLPGTASAHFNLMSPTAADTATDGGKGAPPCGPTSASNMVTPVQGGQELPISLAETVLHPGHYRIALAPTLDLIPKDPDVQTDSSARSISAAIMDPIAPPVLDDDVFDHTSGTTPITFNTTVKLPNINCDHCTLQVIEFMAEHSSNVGGGYFYHHCATLAISADTSLALDSWPGIEAPAANAPGETSAGVGVSTTSTSAASTTSPTMSTAATDGGGCSLSPAAGRTSSFGAAALLALSLGWVARRRR